MTGTAIGRDAWRRVLGAVIHAELRRVRPGDDRANPGAVAAWHDDLPLGDGGLELDSLDIIHVAAAVNEMFHLDMEDGDAPPPVAATVGQWLDAIMAVQHYGARLTLLTSGSTGVPKPCEHAVAELLQEAAYFAGTLTDRTRVVALVPANHIYGLIWTALLPARLGVAVVPASAAAMPALRSGDLVVAVPDQWWALLRSRRRWPADIVGVSAGAPLDDDLIARLCSDGPARTIEVYGASETGGIATRMAGDPFYTLLPRWNFDGTDGSIGGVALIDAAGGVATLPDRIVRVGARAFVLAGRQDGAVQVGGVNVWPRQVAKTLGQCAGLDDIAVRPGPFGRLKAFVVPMLGVDPDGLRLALDAHARATLSVSERPASYRFGDACPVNDLGKAVDWI